MLFSGCRLKSWQRFDVLKVDMDWTKEGAGSYLVRHLAYHVVISELLNDHCLMQKPVEH